jgi:hypothetical protein
MKKFPAVIRWITWETNPRQGLREPKLSMNGQGVKLTSLSKTSG